MGTSTWLAILHDRNGSLACSPSARTLVEPGGKACSLQGVSEDDFQGAPVLGHVQSHRGLYVFVTSAKKAGVSAWSRFFYNAYNLTTKIIGQPAWGAESALRRHYPGPWADFNAAHGATAIKPVPANSMVFVVVRNPYSRFLSGFFDKWDSYGDQQRRWPSGNKTVDDFRRVVAGVRVEFDRVGGWHPRLRSDSCWRDPTFIGGNSHFHPQSVMLGLAQPLAGEHDGSRACSAVRAGVLKIERMHEWYICLVRAMGLRLNDVLTGFRGVTNTDSTIPQAIDCHWHLPGADCSWLADHWGDERVRSSEASSGRRLSSPKGATGKVPAYYDASTAAAVSTIFSVDFSLLEYPLWSGEGVWTQV